MRDDDEALAFYDCDDQLWILDKNKMITLIEGLGGLAVEYEFGLGEDCPRIRRLDTTVRIWSA